MPGWRDSVAQALGRHGRVALARQVLVQPDGRTKFGSVDDDVIDVLADMADFVIIEADGARGKSLKSPGPYEPVIPERTTATVALVGLTGLGLTLCEDNVFRPEIFGRLSGLDQGTIIEAVHAARAIVHPDGHFRNTPESARRIVLLNQADALPPEAAEAAARDFAAEARGHIDRLLAGSLREGRMEVYL